MFRLLEKKIGCFLFRESNKSMDVDNEIYYHIHLAEVCIKKNDKDGAVSNLVEAKVLYLKRPPHYEINRLIENVFLNVGAYI